MTSELLKYLNEQLCIFLNVKQQMKLANNIFEKWIFKQKRFCIRFYFIK